jgi:outer membrane protease
MELKWTARDGYLQYPPEPAPTYSAWTRDTPRIYVYGPGILYEQEYYCPSLGLEVRVRPLAGLEARASFAGFPFVACNDLDSHLLRQLDFYGTFAGGYVLEPTLGASYQLSERATLSLDVAYRRVAGLVGDVVEKGTGVKGSRPADPTAPAPGESAGPYTDGAGAAISYVRAALSLALRY